jgi:2-hydroxy-6-oxonona-2,4-dienedioate hydrolase
MTNCDAQVESLWTQVNGWRMHARAALKDAPPNAPIAVLVHGLVVSSSYMVPLAKCLAPDYRVFAPDLPGFGRSDKPRRSLQIHELADALAMWMDAIEINRATIVGNSFGCQIAVEFAIRNPERVTRLVLLSPTTDPRARTMVQQTVRWLLNSTQEPPSLGLILLRDYLAAGIARAVRTFRMSVNDEIHKKLPYVPIPTLVVRGANDTIAPERWADEAAKLLPLGERATIPGVGHTLNYNAPLESARVIRLFENGAGDGTEKRGT